MKLTTRATIIIYQIFKDYIKVYTESIKCRTLNLHISLEWSTKMTDYTGEKNAIIIFNYLDMMGEKFKLFCVSFQV